MQQRPRLPFPVWSLATATSAAIAVILSVVLSDQFASTGAPGGTGAEVPQPGAGEPGQRWETNPDGRPMEFQPGRPTSVSLVPSTTVVDGTTVVTPSPSPVLLPIPTIVPTLIPPAPAPETPAATTTGALPVTTTPATTGPATTGPTTTPGVVAPTS
ncbi:hypothetical protein [Allokutzneria oryzae]|uniref:Uncharacterized protein n=1 Tax=Allokutzneria oryzae TaxID=1378989 RepID=A0ABV6A7M2_9PSEU